MLQHFHLYMLTLSFVRFALTYFDKIFRGYVKLMQDKVQTVSRRHLQPFLVIAEKREGGGGNIYPPAWRRKKHSANTYDLVCDRYATYLIFTNFPPYDRCRRYIIHIESFNITNLLRSKSIYLIFNLIENIHMPQKWRYIAA